MTNGFFFYNEIIKIQPFFQNVSNSFTYEFWLKPEAPHKVVGESNIGTSGIHGQKYIIGPGYPSTKEYACIGVSIGTNGISVFEHSESYLPALLVYETTIKKLTHISIVYNNRTPYLYINGQFIKKGLKSSKELVFPSGTIGGCEPYGFYIGYIKEIKLWKQSKSEEEIKNEILNKSKVHKDGLIGVWKFNQKGLILEDNALSNELSIKQNRKLDKLTVLFVKSGFEDNSLPYRYIEQSIIVALKGIVKELYVCVPSQDVALIAKQKNPHLIIVFNGFNFPVSQLIKLRETRIKTAIWMSDDPYYTDVTKNVVNFYDFIFTQEINCIPFYRSVGSKNVYYLPLAADTELFKPKEVDEKYKTDILFIGSAFSNRIKIIDALAHYLSTKNLIISGIWWEKLSNYALLKDKIRTNTWLSPDETASYYNGAKIVINMHRCINTTENSNIQNINALSINPRTFEISSCGVFQLSDVRPGLNCFYTQGFNIATYSTAEDLAKQIEYYLVNEKEREMIASNSLKTIHAKHTYNHRVNQLLNYIIKD